jgi:hypothetical protein
MFMNAHARRFTIFAISCLTFGAIAILGGYGMHALAQSPFWGNGDSEAVAVAVPGDTSAAPTRIVDDMPTTNPLIILGALGDESNSRILVQAGQVIQFVSPVEGGGTYQLFTGLNGIYIPASGAPSVLNDANGMLITPGQTRPVTFLIPGTYTITSASYPDTLIHIIVKASLLKNTISNF